MPWGPCLAPGLGTSFCSRHPPPPAPGMRTYPCDNLTGCGSTVGGWLEGRLSSETCKFQHTELLSSGPGPRGLASAGTPGTQTRPVPHGRQVGGRS